MATADASGWLVPLSGPALDAINLGQVADSAEGAGVTVGRGDACGVRLPADADKVSRQHARFVRSGGRWRVADAGSRWGTFLNGVKLVAQKEVPLGEGDLIRIVPWTFHFSTLGPPRRGLVADDDVATHGTMIRSHAPDDSAVAKRPMAEDLLALLLESAAAVHAAGTEAALAEVLIDAGVRGTGMANAAVLRPLDAAGRLEVVAARQSSASHGSPPTFSRSLIAAASGGSVAELATGDGVADVAVSVMQMGIRSAVCVPIMLGEAVADYLYLDSRTPVATGPAGQGGAASFCLALGRMAGLALANLKRVEIERRQAALEHDLSAAAVAQRWILPERETEAAGFRVTGESRAGEYLGGDFFDLIPLGDHRLAIALGDVAGHGVAASVLMSAAQGFLHAALMRHCVGETHSVGQAVTDLCRFICPRRPPNSFLTLWVGVFDSAARQVTYVNAGHGHATLIAADGTLTKLDGGDDMPIGFDDEAVLGEVTEPLPVGGQALLLSDGIIEQFVPNGSRPDQQFGFDGAVAAVRSAKGDAVAALFGSVVRHAQSDHLQDDATAVLVRW
jgi:serine phosphatase RsbU (regulator of sigma subunit)